MFFSREYAVISSTVMSSECNSTGIVKCAMSCTSCDIFCTLLGKKKERTGNRTVKTVLQFWNRQCNKKLSCRRRTARHLVSQNLVSCCRSC